jgi:hypothetical protein
VTGSRSRTAATGATRSSASGQPTSVAALKIPEPCR